MSNRVKIRNTYRHKKNLGDNERGHIGKKKVKNQTFPKRIIIDEKEIFEQNIIADKLYKFFTEIGQKLASKMNSSSNNFMSYLSKISRPNISNTELTVDELGKAFSSLKRNKLNGLMIYQLTFCLIQSNIFLIP